MRPERFDWANSLSVRNLRVLAAILFTLIVLNAGAARAAESPPQSSAGPVYDSQSFLRELERLRAGLEDARKSADALHSYRESLPETWSVEAGGRHFVVPADLLVSRVVGAEKQPGLRGQQLDEARDYLDALAAETASLRGQPPARMDSARAILAAILARPEYAHARQESWWDKLRARISEILLNALSRILRGVGGQASLGYVLLWIAICAAAILIAYWIFRRWFRTARLEEMALQSAAVPSWSWQEWIFAAREAAGRNDYRMAIHCAYWAGIARLQDLGALTHDRANTPREYLQALTKSKLILPETLAVRHQALSLLTSRLEKSWYGYHAATEADFRDSLSQLETLGCHLP
ncbi:MAG TPA: DUF4129 domain-containing protein [Candidatus Acidoferrales bacterium]|jgi:hypothetical protein|nr:DUF4129 domain-containing protein [Candidatus Acidoferrales bacterium]